MKVCEEIVDIVATLKNQILFRKRFLLKLFHEKGCLFFRCGIIEWYNLAVERSSSNAIPNLRALHCQTQ